MLLYYMCCGKPPYYSYGKLRGVQLLMGIVQGTLALEWPEDTYRLLRRLSETCCQRDPASRPPFSRIVAALQRLMRHVVEHPGPASLPRREDRHHGSGGGSAAAAGINSLGTILNVDGIISLGCLDTSGELRHGDVNTCGGEAYDRGRGDTWTTHDSQGADLEVPRPLLKMSMSSPSTLAMAGAARASTAVTRHSSGMKATPLRESVLARSLLLPSVMGGRVPHDFSPAAAAAAAAAAGARNPPAALTELAMAARQPPLPPPPPPSPLQSTAYEASSACATDFSSILVDRCSCCRSQIAGTADCSQVGLEVAILTVNTPRFLNT